MAAPQGLGLPTAAPAPAPAPDAAAAADLGRLHRQQQRVDLSDWDPTYMSWAPAEGARSATAWSEPVLVGAPVPQMDTNFAAVIDKDGRLVGMWRDHHRDAAGTKAKSTIHLVTASDWKDNSTYVFERDDLLFSGQPYPGGVEDPVRIILIRP